MSDTPTLQRPRQVTMAAWMVIAGSGFLVATAFERVASFHHLETREALTELLAEPPVKGLGLDLEGALVVLQAFAMVTAGCAAAAMILGYHVLKRHRGARLALTVLAVPLFLSGMVLGGFLSSLVAVSTVMLWLAPSRDWFNGIAPRPVPEAGPSAPPPQAPRQASSPPADAPAPPTSGPRPHQGFGSAPAGPPQAPPPYAPPYAPPQPASQQPPYPSPYPPQYPPPFPPPPPGARPYAAPPPATLTGRTAPPSWTRPSAVLVACVITWIVSSLAVLVMVGTVALVWADPDALADEMHRQNPDLTTHDLGQSSLVALTVVTAVLVVVWSLAAIVLAILVFRRSRWARYALLGSAGSAGGLCVVVSLQSPLFVGPLLACAAAFSLLLRPEVRAWFARS